MFFVASNVEQEDLSETVHFFISRIRHSHKYSNRCTTGRVKATQLKN